MRKIAAIAALLLAATGIYAQSFSINSVSGFGLLSEAGASMPNAQFALQVSQIQFNDQSQLWGGFQMNVRTQDALISIFAIPTALEIDMENKTATISGNAILYVRTRSGYERVRGTVTISVADNRSPRNPSNNPDLLSLSFQAESDPEGDPEYSYSGAVLRGDIAIRQYSR